MDNWFCVSCGATIPTNSSIRCSECAKLPATGESILSVLCFIEGGGKYNQVELCPRCFYPTNNNICPNCKLHSSQTTTYKIERQWNKDER